MIRLRLWALIRQVRSAPAMGTDRMSTNLGSYCRSISVRSLGDLRKKCIRMLFFVQCGLKGCGMFGQTEVRRPITSASVRSYLVVLNFLISSDQTSVPDWA